ncbi:MAG TPA: DUF3040 domain-containing protein [Blastocatellia bacterium]|nr:DUF3040 domain-containing protein [Blastocatellia bacterium]
MYCPNCGKKNSGQEKYCRSCGLHLNVIIQVTGAEVAGLRKRSREIAEQSESESPRGMLVRRPRMSPLGFLIVMTGVLIAFLGGAAFSSHWIAVAGTLVMIIGMIVLGLQAMNAGNSRRRALGAGGPADFDESTVPERNLVPGGQLYPAPPSITEVTTRSLDAGLEVSNEKSRDTQPALSVRDSEPQTLL